MPSHALHLKVEQPIMLLRNVDPANGLCNGTRLICKRFAPHLIEAEIMAGKHRGSEAFSTAHTLQFSGERLEPGPLFSAAIPNPPGVRNDDKQGTGPDFDDGRHLPSGAGVFAWTAVRCSVPMHPLHWRLHRS